jgi:hypothetical protein
MHLLLRLSLSVAFVVASFHTPAALAADACSLLAQTEAAAVTGQPIVEVMPGGPRRDEDSGGQLSYCTYRAAASAVVVSVVEYPSHDDALKQLSKSVAQERVDMPAAGMKEEPGLGEKSFYGASAKGATFLFLQGNKVIGVGVGGAGPVDGAGVKESLRAAAKAVAAKA